MLKGNLDRILKIFKMSGDFRRRRLRRPRFIEDLAHGPHASPALRLAAEMPVNLARRARRVGRDKRFPHLFIAQHTAGTDDHAPETCFVSGTEE
jgi:hypothetical protein